MYTLGIIGNIVVIKIRERNIKYNRTVNGKNGHGKMARKLWPWYKLATEKVAMEEMATENMATEKMALLTEKVAMGKIGHRKNGHKKIIGYFVL